MNSNLFAQLLAANPDAGRIAVELGDGSMRSYGELFAETGRLANLLAARGVRTGDRVAAKVEKSFAVLALYLATLRAGGVFLPLNTAYTLAETRYFLEDAEPALVVCDPRERDGIADIAQAISAKVETLDAQGAGSLIEAAAACPAAFDTVERAPDDLAAILYTSGTTGRSKGAMLTHDNLASNALTLREAWAYTADDVLIHALPMYHTHGLFVACNLSLFASARMILLPKFDAARIPALLPRATVLMGVPTFYTRLLDAPALTREACADMRLFVSGSAPLLADTHAAWTARTGHRILERYGMTETNMITSNPYDGERRPGSVGLPLPGVSVRIADEESGAQVARGDYGIIEVRGPNVFKGYWRMPEKTAAEFRPDGYFITGDIGVEDEDGYVSIIGRGKDLIISGGFNVYPKEIETEIDGLAGVAESAVVGAPHSDFGEAVVAFVVAERRAAPDEAAILAQLGQRLARFKLPKRVVFVDELPRNTMGKVQKNVLRERCAGFFVEQVAH